MLQSGFSTDVGRNARRTCGPLRILRRQLVRIGPHDGHKEESYGRRARRVVLKDAHGVGVGAAFQGLDNAGLGYANILRYLPGGSVPNDGGRGVPQLVGVKHHAIDGFTSIGGGIEALRGVGHRSQEQME